jgi:hypothetical protein
MSGRESSKVFIGTWFGLSACGEGCPLGGVYGDVVGYPLLTSGQVQVMSRRTQFAQRGRPSLHYEYVSACIPRKYDLCPGFSYIDLRLYRGFITTSSKARGLLE